MKALETPVSPRVMRTTPPAQLPRFLQDGFTAVVHGVTGTDLANSDEVGGGCARSLPLGSVADVAAGHDRVPLTMGRGRTRRDVGRRWTDMGLSATGGPCRSGRPERPPWPPAGRVRRTGPDISSPFSRINNFMGLVGIHYRPRGWATILGCVGIRRSPRRRSTRTLLSPASLAFPPAGPPASASFRFSPRRKRRVTIPIGSMTVGKKLYVGNLTYQVSESDLEQLFSEYGTVQTPRSFRTVTRAAAKVSPSWRWAATPRRRRPSRAFMSGSTTVDASRSTRPSPVSRDRVVAAVAAAGAAATAGAAIDRADSSIDQDSPCQHRQRPRLSKSALLG